MATNTIAIVGVGQAGHLVGQLLCRGGGLNLVLVDTAAEVARQRAEDLRRFVAMAGGAMDIAHASQLSAISGADVVIVAAGLPTMAGLGENDWLFMNADAMAQVGKAIGAFAPSAFVICLAGPVPVMTARLQGAASILPNHIVGVPARGFIAQLTHEIAAGMAVATVDIRINVIGGEFHTDDTAALLRYSTVAGVPLPEIVRSGLTTWEGIEVMVTRARKAVGVAGAGLNSRSVSSAPAALAVTVANSYLSDQKRVLTLAACLDGAYGVSGVVANVPVVIGRRGVERIFELGLEDAERAVFAGAIADFRRRMTLLEGRAPAFVQTGTAP